MKKLYFAGLCFLAAMLCSCLGMDAELELKDGGGASLRMSYTVPQPVVNIRKSDGTRLVKLPFDDDSLRFAAERSGGRILSSESSGDADSRRFSFSMDFDTYDAAAVFLTQADFPAEYIRESSELRIKLCDASAAAGPMAEIADSFAENTDVNIRIVLPGDVLDILPGNMVREGRVVSFRSAAPELCGGTEDYEIRVRWQDGF